MGRGLRKGKGRESSGETADRKMVSGETAGGKMMSREIADGKAMSRRTAGRKAENRKTGEQRKRRAGREKWLHILGQEVAVEYKACLYFFVILFFYAMYLLTGGKYEASLLHMAEMIIATYGMGYFQVLALDNFDEAEHFSWRELCCSFLCTGLYAATSYLCSWFDRDIAVTGIFSVYCMIVYGSAYLANKVKRYIDTKQLNDMLQAYQRGGKGNGERHREEETDEGLW